MGGDGGNLMDNTEHHSGGAYIHSVGCGRVYGGADSRLIDGTDVRARAGLRRRDQKLVGRDLDGPHRSRGCVTVGWLWDDWRGPRRAAQIYLLVFGTYYIVCCRVVTFPHVFVWLTTVADKCNILYCFFGLLSGSTHILTSLTINHSSKQTY